jgi:predicted  nucleic acid-binding Zn-ribbon protein
MKIVKLNEEAYNKLLNEIGYGNDDLDNLKYELKISLSDALQVIRDHMTMCERLKQEPNAYVVEINEHLNAIKEALEALNGGLN